MWVLPENGRVCYPRGKTGIERNLPLWPETIRALKGLQEKGELVFYTRKGNPWVRTIRRKEGDGTEKYTKDDAISKEFSKLMKKAGIKAPKGVGFYTLRRTAATLAAHSGDPFAVQKLLGQLRRNFRLLRPLQRHCLPLPHFSLSRQAFVQQVNVLLLSSSAFQATWAFLPDAPDLSERLCLFHPAWSWLQL
jgi:hypothetical protein